MVTYTQANGFEDVEDALPFPQGSLPEWARLHGLTGLTADGSDALGMTLEVFADDRKASGYEYVCVLADPFVRQVIFCPSRAALTALRVAIAPVVSAAALVSQCEEGRTR